MVDVSGKEETRRVATATGWLTMRHETLRSILAGDARKGSVITTAEVAGVMAAKQTAVLIPLCHHLPQVNVRVALRPDTDLPGLRASARATVAAGTGVEMEALTAVSVALLTAYDMAKSLERGMEIGGVRLVRKEGGRSGSWQAD